MCRGGGRRNECREVVWMIRIQTMHHLEKTRRLMIWLIVSVRAFCFGFQGRPSDAGKEERMSRCSSNGERIMEICKKGEQ